MPSVEIISSNDMEILLDITPASAFKDTIPEGYNKYSIRHSDEGDEWFCTLEKFVWANHMGDFITDKEVPLDDVDNYIYINGDYSYIDN